MTLISTIVERKRHGTYQQYTDHGAVTAIEIPFRAFQNRAQNECI